MNKIRLFISYSIKDAVLAGNIRRSIEKDERFSCFLAHDDIQPGSEWELAIRNSLFDADCVLTIQTESFRASYWCQQEIGMALQLGKPIIPLRPTSGIDPQGFLSKYQAFTIKEQNLEESIGALLSSELLLAQADVLQKRLDEAVQFEKLLVHSTPIQIKAGIDAEKAKYLRGIEEHFVALKSAKGWQEYWQAHVDMMHAASNLFILANQIIRFKQRDAWEEYLKLLIELRGVSAEQDRYGGNGWISHLIYSFFLILGGMLIKEEYLEGLKKLVTLKVLKDNRLTSVLDWNMHANYIEERNKVGEPKYYVPRFKYTLDLVEEKSFPIKLKNFEDAIVDFDLFCFLYSIKAGPTDWPWYPCSIYYFDYRTPHFLNLIKQDAEARELWAKVVFNMSEGEFLTFVREKAVPTYTDLQRKSQGFTSDSPFKIFFEKKS